MTDEEAWVRFAAASLAAGEEDSDDAARADQLLKAYRERFPLRHGRSPAWISMDDGVLTMGCDTGVLRVDDHGIYLNGRLLFAREPKP
jgi:hypothetical protein